ncbi:hypothetical protein TEA_025320 [Camellia sinensis var. sinensis]|uniref:Uncharacterized protein n=1 Tax=Camellia sinensis var. sinensis TaxID=542762 RepID=A0A4S4D111_CAMSN|nr:hypothetical protein TEA_025320 [Camellia sinensis var. sinensis]
MAENGEEKLIQMARHIAKTLGHTDTMADDILQIFSNFDGRFREKLVEKLSDEDPRSLEQNLKALDRRISPYVSADHPIWSDSADASSFLDAVDELVSAIREWTPMAGDKPVAACLHRADDLLQQSMFRLEDEFRLLMDRGCESFDLTRFQNGESAANYAFESEDDEEDEDGEMIGEENQIPVYCCEPVYTVEMCMTGLDEVTSGADVFAWCEGLLPRRCELRTVVVEESFSRRACRG